MREGFTDCGARGGHAACRVYGSRRHYSPLLHSPHTVGKVKNKPLDSWHQRELFSCFFLQDNMTHDIEEPFLQTLRPLCHLYCQKSGNLLREGVNGKKTSSFGHCPNDGGGGLSMPEFFGPLFRSAFLVNKKSLFLQKCQCIELLTVF